MLIIAKTDPRIPQATVLLQQSHALMQELFTPDQNSYLDIDELCAPHIQFFTARDKQVTVGTAALASFDGYGEVKSMFVAPNARGIGVAQALLRQVEDAARDAGLPLLRLETGDRLLAACHLYRRFGFQDRGPFGDYTENGASIFMEKTL
ncbi:MAG: GNAT family N-acetyltransferase [Pseudomonadota bacterium]